MHGQWCDELALECSLVTWHNHFCAFCQFQDCACNISSADEKLWFVVAEEWGVASSFFLLQYVQLTFEGLASLDRACLPFTMQILVSTGAQPRGVCIIPGFAMT